MSEQLPDEPERDGTPETIPTKTADAELELTDEGIEIPEFLRGFTGNFTVRTPNVTGEFETSEAGIPSEEVANVIFAEMPEAGDYHGELEAGMMALSTEETPETVFEIIDNRSDSD